MGRLNLKASTPNEKLVLAHLEKVASDSLAERINNGKKDLADCWTYIVSEAKKLAKKGCAVVDDATVFGWAVHFFEEDDIKVGNEDKPQKENEQTPPKKDTKKTPAKNDVEQLSFDFF